MNDDISFPPNDLSRLLARADTGDLDLLVEHVTDGGKGRLSLNSDVCARLVKCKARGAYTESDRNLVGQEILAFGGNTVANAYRDIRKGIRSDSWLGKLLPEAGSTIGYAEMLRDVASHLKVEFDRQDSDIAVEAQLVRKLFRDMLEKMSPDEYAAMRSALGLPVTSFSDSDSDSDTDTGDLTLHQMSLIVANATSLALLDYARRGIGPTAATALLGGPGLLALTSPAYRVTIPCVIQLACVRQKAIASQA